MRKTAAGWLIAINGLGVVAPFVLRGKQRPPLETVGSIVASALAAASVGAAVVLYRR